MEAEDAPARTVVVKRSELELAFDFVSFAAPMEHSASISIETGQIYWQAASGAIPDEDLPDDLDDGDGYISVPHKTDLDLGRRLVLRFVGQEMPDDFDTVDGFFRRRGAYGRFKDLLQRRDMLEQWYAFEERATKEALAEWCEENGIQLVDDKPGVGDDKPEAGC